MPQPAKPVVMRSVESADGTRCIDLVVQGTGWSWVECRRDPEDSHGWRPTGRRVDGFATQLDAVRDAAAQYVWMKEQEGPDA